MMKDFGKFHSSRQEKEDLPEGEHSGTYVLVCATYLSYYALSFSGGQRANTNNLKENNQVK